MIYRSQYIKDCTTHIYVSEWKENKEAKKGVEIQQSVKQL